MTRANQYKSLKKKRNPFLYQNTYICIKNVPSPFQDTTVTNVVTPDENDNRISSLQVVDVTDKKNTI